MDRPAPRKPSWKDSAGARPAPSPRHAWQDKKVADPVAPARPWWKSRRAKLAGVLAGMGGLAALIVSVILWLHTSPPMRLVLIGAHYEDNLAVPHNLAGWDGVQALKEWAKTHNEVNQTADKGNLIDVQDVALGADDDADAALVKPILDNSWLRGSPKTLVIYVSACGMVCTRKGDVVPCLARPDHLRGETKPYPVDDLLTALGKLPAQAKKLLLLDVTPVDAYWPMGQFHQSFVRVFTERLKQKNIENLIVISSAGPDERSWGSTGRGMSIFAHFVREGLKGAADKLDSQSPGATINALDLYQYTRDKVEHWVWQNRTRVQRPVLLYGTEKLAKEMPLLRHGAYTETALPKETPLADADLQRAWEECLQLRDSVPSPDVYTPHLWREYLDGLLRAEDLIRAGHGASEWFDKLRALAEKIKAARKLSGDSGALTLAMPQAFGEALPPGADSFTKRMLDLWQQRSNNNLTYEAQQKDYEKLRADLVKTFKGSQLQRVRLQLAGLVLKQMIHDPEQNLAYGRSVLANLDDRLAPRRCAEAHYAVMLSPDPGARTPAVTAPLLAAKRWDLVKKALQVRILAEQAALGLGPTEDGSRAPDCEQLLPWVRGMVAHGDRDRRSGEDLLFTSLPDQWKHAETFLGDAAKTYGGAQILARDVRRSLHQRDRTMAELPYYTRWLAGHSQFTDDDAFLRDLWKSVHKLNGLVELDPKKPVDQTVLLARSAELGKVVPSIERDFLTVQQTAAKIAAKKWANATTPDSWHEIEDVLQVPFLPVEDRMNLVRASRSIAVTLEQRLGKDLTVSRDTAAHLENKARVAAQRQGRLALAVLGENWLDYKDSAGAIDQPEEGAWHRSLHRAAEQYGKALIQLGRQAESLTTAAAAAPLPEAGEKLREAALLARQVDGFLVGAPHLKADPVGALRRLQLHNLLCRQATRTRLDFWNSAQGGTPPYYFAAGQVFLRDALALVVNPEKKPVPGQKDPRTARVDEERTKLEAAAPPVLEYSESGQPDTFKPGPVTLYPTDEPRMWLTYRLGVAKAPPGQPVRWVEQSEGMDTRQREGEFLPGQRPATPREIRLALIPGEQSKVVERWHRVVCYFRGHRTAVETTLRVQPEPDLTTTQLPPLKAGRVAVQINPVLYDRFAATRSAISLVLDVSGSMVARDQQGRTRWQKATKALREVLAQLPKDVRVSLHAFGAEQFYDRDDPEYNTSYRLIKRLWPSHKWNNNPQVVKRRMSEVGKLKPAYDTPLVRTIIQAVEEPAFKKFNGARTIVVLTDGADSNFYTGNRDADLHRKYGPTIPEALQRAFGESDIQFHVIGFEVSEQEARQRGHKDFLKAIKELKGAYHDVRDPEKLALALRESLLQMYFWVDADSGLFIPTLPPAGMSVSRTERFYTASENLRWLSLPVKDTEYRVRVRSLRSLWQRVEIEAGDSLLLELAELRRGLGFRRTMYADWYKRSKQGFAMLAEKQSGWQLAALANKQRRGEEKLEIMMTLEKDQIVERNNDLVKVIRPRWTWFQVPAPEGKGPPPPLRVFSLPDYPAPAWSLNLPWPTQGKTLEEGKPPIPPVSKVQAWWIDLEKPLPVAGALNKETFKSPRDLVDYPWPTDDKTHQVRIESVKEEKLDLEVRPGKISRDRLCLVFRLKYPPPTGDGKSEPYFVQLPNWTGGRQYRFYNKVGKSTSIFFLETGDEVDKLRDLQLISVAECKKKALSAPDFVLDNPDDRNAPKP